MRRKFSLLLLLGWVVCTLSAAPIPRFTDALGRERDFTGPAGRLISLSPALTEIVFAVGAEDKLLAVTEFCDFPAAAIDKPKVGGFSGKTISIESIVALRPDLVLLSAEMHEKVAEMLEAVGIKTVALEPSSFASMLEALELVGDLTGESASATALSASLDARLLAVTQAVTGRPPLKGFWELWHDPLMTSGGGTFVSEAIELAGGHNIFADRAENWPAVSFEEVLIRQPDWLLSGDDHGDLFTISQLAARPGWNGLTAVKAGRVALIDSGSVYRAGPRLIEAIETLAGLFHPEAFQTAGQLSTSP